MEPQMHIHTFDTHKLVKAFLGQGFKENQAEVLVQSLVESREYDFARLATKEQLNVLDRKVDGVEERLSARIDAVDKKIDSVEERLLARIDAVDKKVDAVEERLSAKIDNKINESTNRLIKWMFGFFITIMLAIIGIGVPVIMSLSKT